MFAYHAYNDLAQLRDLVNAYFNEAATQRLRTEFPLVNLYEGDDEVEVQAVIPGLASDQVNIELADNSLIIEGEKKEDYTDEPYMRRERQFGTFKRSIKLPYRVDPEKVKAELQDGILTIRLEKSEEARPRRIAIR